MMESETFYSKLILFGEYGVLMGSEALSIPLRLYSGNLDFHNKYPTDAQSSSNLKLRDYFGKLIQNKPDWIDIENISNLNNDLAKGLYFDSNIPIAYGVGSSGALVAALYKRYFYSNDRTDLALIREHLAGLESILHGKSSGIDPLTCFLNHALLFNSSGGFNIVKDFDLSGKGFFLYDSGFSHNTGYLVSDFLKSLYNQDYKEKIGNHYLFLISNCISRLLEKDFDSLMNEMNALSHFQYEYFPTQIIPDVEGLWQSGLSSGDYFFKLCGSGGGGFYIGFTRMSELDFRNKMEFEKRVIFL